MPEGFASPPTWISSLQLQGSGSSGVLQQIACMLLACLAPAAIETFGSVICSKLLKAMGATRDDTWQLAKASFMCHSHS